MATISLLAAASPSSSDDTNSFSITESMVSYLRMEADLADDKAKRLRKQAVDIAEQFGITEDSQQIYGTYYNHARYIFEGMAIDSVARRRLNDDNDVEF